MPPPLDGPRGLPRAWYLASLRGLRRPLVCTGLAVSAAVFVFVWLRDDLSLAGALNDLQMRENVDLLRFSAHCAAPHEGVQGSFAADHLREFTFHSAALIVGHGASSAEVAWPGETGPGPVFDCTPQALPRYWRLNKHVGFDVVGPDGAHVERSFTPDLLPRVPGSASGFVCGPGQLTPYGFQQVVGLGRHLAEAYGELVGWATADSEPVRLQLRSADSKAALASTVGLLMALLAAPQALKAFGDGTRVQIHIEPNASSDMLRSRSAWSCVRDGLVVQDELEEVEKKAKRDAALGEHLLARWCHQLPWPCESITWRGDPQCVSVDHAVRLVRLGEAETCDLLTRAVRGTGSCIVPLLVEVAKLLRGAAQGSLGMLVADGAALTGILVALLGTEACRDPLLVRPPMASHIAFERWQGPSGSGYRWRILWNGDDITSRISRCAGSTPGLEPGFGSCSEAEVKDILRGAGATWF